jgi:excinuclease UvrABC nuclease subunit
MASKSYALTFEGYWREPNTGGLPDRSGIYCVYACTHNRAENTVSLNRLIYIGESENVRGRVTVHERRGDWRRELRAGEELCFTAALISPEGDRLRSEAAMIFRHKPPCNVEYRDAFPFDQTTISTGGRNALLQAYFTVYRTSPSGGLANFLYGYGVR